MSHGARVWAALWAVYIIWGSTYLFIAIAVETLPPLLAVSTRFVAAGALLAVIVVQRGGTMRISRREFVSCFLVGCLLPGANAVLFYAERDVPIGLASLIIASVPLWVVVLRLLLGERVPTPVLVGVGIGFAGVAVLAQPEGGATTIGIVLCVVSALMWSLGSVASARLKMPGDAFAATAWEMLAGGFVMLPFALTSVGSLSPSTSSILAWLYLVTIGSVVGYTAYTWLLANAPLGLVSTYAYVNPVVAILLGLFFRNESVTWRILIGAAIVVSAVALVVRQEPPAATQPEEGVR
ncbi:MAG TPA: EamA family transporter [Gaiellaceae bacterium]|nr:EamA family transporter [Gaiellaceae bacterium]